MGQMIRSEYLGSFQGVQGMSKKETGLLDTYNTVVTAAGRGV